MATPTGIRWRRSLAERHALQSIEREIRSSDTHGRRKYLREFADAYRAYEAPLSSAQLESVLHSADVLLIGDYHALPSSQQFAASLIAQLSSAGRPVVLGLEMVFSRDQHILDEWSRGEINDAEFRERIRFDFEWGYDWTPFRDLLLAARTGGAALFGLDCMPRDDMRRIVARDRHAADKVAEIRQRHSGAVILVLFGESHLAPTHLPLCVRERLPRERVVTVLQNIDDLYWQAAGERCDRVGAVRISADSICVFNSTPLEKYESYRLCLDRWKQERAAAPDLAPSYYNLIDALLRFLNIDKYSSSNGTQPKFLVDLLPEVYSRVSAEPLRRLLERRNATAAEVLAVLQQLESRGSCYVPRLNAMFVTRFQMLHAAEDAAAFVHATCSGTCSTGRPRPAIGDHDGVSQEDAFYRAALEIALADFGSRVLYPARPPMREHDLYALYAQPREAVEERSIYSYRDYMQMLDFLVLHKDYEQNLRGWIELPALLREGVRFGGERFAFLTGMLGQILGSEMYDAWIAGRVPKRTLRSLFFRPLDAPGAARTVYFTIVRRIRKPRRRHLAA